MRTKTYLLRHALLRLGIARAGGAIPPHVSSDAADIVDDTLRALAEEQALNFDPIPSDQIPEEYVPRLVKIMANQLAMPMGKPALYDPLLFEFEKQQLRALTIGESDALDTEPRDY